ncbi:interleukin-1 receptor-like 1 [Hoplias malabaricus]|uniref:interleukin-1 receptor-like 1 n=1 Tax=Hoplias malabaricus TaxID=27720 RepID=UPI0034636EC4
MGRCDDKGYIIIALKAKSCGLHQVSYGDYLLTAGNKMIRLWLITVGFLSQNVITSSYTDTTVQCDRHQNGEQIKVIQGEGLHWPCPNIDCSLETDHLLISWFKNSSDGLQEITANESNRVHHHGPNLYILPLTLSDSGLYITRWMESNDHGCNEFETYIKVYEGFNINQLYSNLTEEPPDVRISCPVCEDQNKSLTWYKDFHLIPGQTEEFLHINNFSKNDEGIYTCLCTWEHHNRKYNSSGSRKLHIKDPTTSFSTMILYPRNNSVVVIDLGSKVVLTCLAFFGINMRDNCFVLWLRNNTSLDGVKGYTINQRIEIDKFNSYLIIDKVSEVDLQSEFKCKAVGLRKGAHVNITLKSRESVLPLVVMILCTFLVFLLCFWTTKWLTVDLALFFRGLWVTQKNRDDGKVYDAYVIHQKNNMDEETENSLAHFIHRVLPDILENRCGFKLYIHGRDDLPGEDFTELTEKTMQLSRRLIVVLTPETSQSQEVTTPQDYDWKVGLHQVMIQQEMSIILIQLGDIKDYSHLPLGLQHLLQKTPPLKWSESSRKATSPSSRFWKKVRYMMPAIPAEKSSLKSASTKLHSQEHFDIQC